MTNTPPIDHIAADNKKVSDPSVPDELKLAEEIIYRLQMASTDPVPDDDAARMARSLVDLFTQYATDIDITKMNYEQLNNLRANINVELEERSQAEMTAQLAATPKSTYYLECPKCHHTCGTDKRMVHADDCKDKGYF